MPSADPMRTCPAMFRRLRFTSRGTLNLTMCEMMLSHLVSLRIVSVEPVCSSTIAPQSRSLRVGAARTTSTSAGPSGRRVDLDGTGDRRDLDAGAGSEAEALGDAFTLGVRRVGGAQCRGSGETQSGRFRGARTSRIAPWCPPSCSTLREAFGYSQAKRVPDCIRGWAREGSSCGGSAMAEGTRKKTAASGWRAAC
jgi:hypothetical protein